MKQVEPFLNLDLNLPDCALLNSLFEQPDKAEGGLRL